MPVAIKVPSVGESIVEGTIAHWLKKDGTPVRANEPLFELETEKATSTVPAPADGTLHIDVGEGQTVAIGAVVGHIDPGAAAPADDKTAKGKTEKAARADAEPKAAPATATVTQDETQLAPAVRHLIEEEGLDPKAIPGTGRGGRITKEDVLTFIEQRKKSQPAGPAKKEEKPLAPAPPPERPAEGPPSVQREIRQRMSAIRLRIAERLVASQKNTATLTTFNEVDMSAVMALRSRYKDRFKDRYHVNLGFMPFFVKACVEALRTLPVVNSRIDGTDIVTYQYYNVGVAVSTEKGLMVPVIRDADRMGFAQIDKAIAEVAARAREGKISVSDLQGGTFTITNGGVFGSLLSTPILNPPQSAILGMHTIQKRPVVVDDQIVIRPMMYLALSYDHRTIDGREAVLFLVRVKECIEDPERLLLEV